MIELDFGPGLVREGGQRDLASEHEDELLVYCFHAPVRFVVGRSVVFDSLAPFLNLVEMAARSAWAVAAEEAVHVSLEHGGGKWSVEPERGRVRLEYPRRVPGENKHVTESVSVGRVELASALGAFVLRALDAAERLDAGLAMNPWTRRVRRRTRTVLAEVMDRSIVTVAMVGGADTVDAARRLACRVWSYGGLPDAVPAPIDVEVLADPDVDGAEVAVEVTGGRPRVDVITRPETASDPGALADAVWPGIGEVFGVYGATAHPLYHATHPV